MSRERVNHFIQCDCQSGGLLVHGIDLEENHCSVLFFNVHTYGTGTTPSFWTRVKDAWKILFAHDLRAEDVVLDHKGVIELRNACQDTLNRWPEERLPFAGPETLEELYQSMQDEQIGKEIRKNGGRIVFTGDNTELCECLSSDKAGKESLKMEVDCTRSVLLDSKLWQEECSKLDIIALGNAGPLDMSEWDEKTHVYVRIWARGYPMEMPSVISHYLNMASGV